MQKMAFGPGFQEFMARERKTAMRGRACIHTFDNDRAAILRDFPLARLLAREQGKIALSFWDFHRICTTTGIMYSRRELASGKGALERELMEYFLFLDADNDGLLGMSDADGSGRVGNDSRGFAHIWRRRGAGKPYGSRPNGAFPEYERRKKEYMDGKLRRINASLRKRETGGFCVYEYTLPVIDLPQGLSGVKILHISDIHFHEVAERKRNWLAAKASERIRRRNGEKISFLENIASYFPSAPDIVAVTGDFIVKGASDITERALGALRGVFPSAFRFFTRGNEEHGQGGGEEITRTIIGAGFKDLTNRQERIMVNGQFLNLAGVDDCFLGDPAFPAPAGRQRIEPYFLFMHNLDALDRKVPGHYDGVFWGHTHGREPFGLGLPYLRMKGSFCNLNGKVLGWGALSPRTFSYNSPGLGSHFPLRGLSPPEGVTAITLAPE